MVSYTPGKAGGLIYEPLKAARYFIRLKAAPIIISWPALHIPGDLDCAFAFDISNHLAYRAFGWNFNAHMHVIDAKMSLDAPVFSLARQFMQNFSRITS